MGVSMKKYINQGKIKHIRALYLGLSDIGRVTQDNSNLLALRETFPKSWAVFQEDIECSRYLENGLSFYQEMDYDDIDVAFLPAYDRYCDGDTMIYIFKLLKKLIRAKGIQYDSIVILGLSELKPEFKKRLVASFPLVFKDFKEE